MADSNGCQDFGHVSEKKNENCFIPTLALKVDQKCRSPEVQLPYFLTFMSRLLYCLRWFFAKEMETVVSSIT